MNPESAAWVREHVWSPWMKQMDDEYRARKNRPGEGCFLFSRSPCEEGVCPPCRGKSAGGHAACRTRRRITDPAPWWKTIAETRTLNVYAKHSGYRRVTEVFTSCRGWICPCDCWRDAITSNGQLALSGVSSR